LTKSLVSINARMDIVVYDNSPTPMVTESECINDNWTIHYIHDKTNPGVSKAYNTGFRIAKKLHKNWFLLLDQDTFFPENALVEYSKAIQENPGIFLFAPILISNNRIMSPCKYFLHRGYSVKKVKHGVCNFSMNSLLSSGMLIYVEAFKRVGGYNEKIRLDFADHSFIERYKAHYNYFALINLRCSHGFFGNQDLTTDAALVRLAYYCEGAKHFANNFRDSLILTLVVAARTVKLSLTHKNLKFFVIFYNYFFARKTGSKEQ
jgi:glycosyltransferase involved in cell wall biosynthesis